jgi:hypothetical protein
VISWFSKSYFKCNLYRYAAAGNTVLFSSLASMLGSGGQANYVAANGWLDDWAVGAVARGQSRDVPKIPCSDVGESAQNSAKVPKMSFTMAACPVPTPWRDERAVGRVERRRRHGGQRRRHHPAHGAPRRRRGGALAR